MHLRPRAKYPKYSKSYQVSTMFSFSRAMREKLDSPGDEIGPSLLAMTRGTPASICMSGDLMMQYSGEGLTYLFKHRGLCRPKRLVCRISVLSSSSRIKNDEIIESGTPRIRLAKTLKDRKHREKHKQILLEGWRLINDAILAKAEPVAVFYSKPNLLSKISVVLPETVTAQVSDNTMSLLSNATTPPGIVGVFKRPQQGEEASMENSEHHGNWKLPLTVLCDKLKDPTNLGTLIRTAAGAGCQALITTRGSVDMWEPKVLRCAAGGHFRLPVYYNLSWEEIREKIPNNSRVYLADNTSGACGQKQLYYEIEWALEPSVLVIGGETTGLSDEARGLARDHGGSPVKIPLTGGVESLSAGTAGSIILYEALRQLHVHTK